MWLGLRCYSKKVSSGRKAFTREEFRFRLSLLGFNLSICALCLLPFKFLALLSLSC